MNVKRIAHCACIYTAAAKHQSLPTDGGIRHVLPEPGDEQMWLDELPAADRAHMQGVGSEAFGIQL
jgi:hypothetical protein